MEAVFLLAPIYMKKIISLFCILLFFNCQNSGQLKTVADLPNTLKNVSGSEIIGKSDVIWMANDGANSPKLFAVSFQGKIIKTIAVQAENNDWEDVTSDDEGNLYIGDFGNNYSERKNLKILKIDKKFLNKEIAAVEEIAFKYEDQTKYPPKKKNHFFDAESFFYYKNNFYIFTKSRVKKEYGKTSLYKIPAKPGKHTAVLIGEYENCKKKSCWITSADISPDKSKVALLSQRNILIFTDFETDNFLLGKVKEIPLNHQSQKEGITFKDNNTLIITDEKYGRKGGAIYEIKIE